VDIASVNDEGERLEGGTILLNIIEKIEYD